MSPSGKRFINDEAICLIRRDFSESSLIVVFLCRNLGKVSVLAKGARRPTGRNPLAVDLLDIGQVGLIVNPEGLGLLREFACSWTPSPLRNDLDKWNVGLYLAELVNMATKELAPAAELFDLFRDVLERTAAASSRQELSDLLVNTTKAILTWAGFEPELRCCVGCRRSMGPTDNLFFSASQGGLICRDCEPGIVDKARLEHRAWYYLTGKVSDVTSARMAFEVLSYMIVEQLGKLPKMQRYCRDMFAASAPPKGQAATKM